MYTFMSSSNIVAPAVPVDGGATYDVQVHVLK